MAAGHFALGTLLGLAILPVAYLVGLSAGGGSTTGWLTFAALTAGAVTLPPVRAARVGGVVTGLFVAAASGVGWWLWQASHSTWG